MKDDYRISGETKSFEIQVEPLVVSTLEAMAAHTKITASELANTALKRFIASHKDFLPREAKKASA